MLTHIVLVTLKDGVTDDKVQAALEALAALPEAIPEIRSFDCGRDAGLIASSADIAFVATFDSVDDFTAYREHPAHQAFARDVLRPIAEGHAVIQFPRATRSG